MGRLERAGRRLGELALGGLLEGLTALCGRVSIDRCLALARGTGRVWVALAGPRTRCVRAALALSLPEASDSERERMVREVFEHLACGLVELLLLRGRQRAALLARVELAGIEHVEAAARATPSGGVLVVTAHLGNWELACAKVAALGFPVSVVYRGLGNAVLDRALVELRGRAGREPGGVPVEQIRMGPGAGRALVRAFEAGRRVLVLLDQNADRDEGVFVPFFGRPACTRSGPVALARARGVPIVPAFIRRCDAGRRHCIGIEPALAAPAEPLASGDEAALVGRQVAAATGAIEAAIRRSPGQWIWLHRRWRTRPLPGDRVEEPFAAPRARV